MAATTAEIIDLELRPAFGQMGVVRSVRVTASFLRCWLPVYDWVAGREQVLFGARSARDEVAAWLAKEASEQVARPVSRSAVMQMFPAEGMARLVDTPFGNLAYEIVVLVSYHTELCAAHNATKWASRFARQDIEICSSLARLVRGRVPEGVIRDACAVPFDELARWRARLNVSSGGGAYRSSDVREEEALVSRARQALIAAVEV